MKFQSKLNSDEWIFSEMVAPDGGRHGFENHFYMCRCTTGYWPITVWMPVDDKSRPRKNGQHFADDIFKSNFSYFDSNIAEGVTYKYANFSSDNGLRSIRRQAIVIWTNDDLVCWRIYASLGLHGFETDKRDAVYQIGVSVNSASERRRYNVTSSLIGWVHTRNGSCIEAWWRTHASENWVTMMTSSNGNIFLVTGPLCGNSPVTGEFPSQRPVTRGFDIFFDLRLNKRLSKQWWGWWFETPSLWRHCNVYFYITGSRTTFYRSYKKLHYLLTEIH